MVEGKWIRAAESRQLRKDFEGRFSMINIFGFPDSKLTSRRFSRDETLVKNFRRGACRPLFFIFLLFLETACGFRPVYDDRSSGRASLASIEVVPVQNVEGTYFYNHLKNLLPPEKDAKYTLNASLSFSRSYNIIQRNSDILRETQTVTVSWRLSERNSSKILTSGSFTRMNSYSTDQLLYSNAIARQESLNMLAENAAEEIMNRLIIFFATIP